MDARSPVFRAGRLAGTVCGVALCLLAVALLPAGRWLVPTRPYSHDKLWRVEVEAGATARTVGQRLHALGLVPSAEAFVWVARLWGLDRHLRAGVYRVRGGLSVPELVRVLAEGKAAAETVTIPEGVSIRTIAAILARKGLVDPKRFIRLASDDRWLAPHLRARLGKPPGSLEGYLFPDTYQFAPGQGEELILQQMVERFAQRMVPLYRQLARDPGLSLHEAVILASIVEKEAAVAQERERIASVFYNRLRLGRPLQADPTVLYALGRESGRLSRRDLEVDSPYNTYRRPGLPPTPIGNPGEASLRAVLQPETTPYLYFVARGDGTHVFSRTFQEHRDARRRLAARR